MKVKREKLLTVLEKLEKGLATREIIEQSTSYIFKDDRVLTYNDEVAISVACDLDIEGAVKGDELVKLLRRLKDEEIEIETDEKEMRVKGKRSKAGIRLEKEITAPLEEISKVRKWKPLTKNFLEGLRFCKFSASNDMTKPLLTCLHVNGRYIEAADNLRAIRYDMGKEAKKCFDKSILIPSRSLSKLVNQDENPSKYSFVDGWFHLKFKNDVIFSCRTFNGDFPNLNKILELEGTTIMFPRRTKEIIDRMKIFTKTEFEQDEYVTITIENEKMIIHGKGEAGWLKERAKVKYKGGKIEFFISPDFLSQILSLLRKVEINLQACRLKLEAKNFTHVVCTKIK